MIVYVDASAAVKLFAREPESIALRERVQDEPGLLVSSVLLETELRRTALRVGVDQRVVSGVLARISLLGTPRGIFTLAGLLPLPGLRTLDALHLATATSNECDAVLTYDHRMIEMAEYAGMATLSPR